MDANSECGSRPGHMGSGQCGTVKTKMHFLFVCKNIHRSILPLRLFTMYPSDANTNKTIEPSRVEPLSRTCLPESGLSEAQSERKERKKGTKENTVYSKKKETKTKQNQAKHSKAKQTWIVAV